MYFIMFKDEEKFYIMVKYGFVVKIDVADMNAEVLTSTVSRLRNDLFKFKLTALLSYMIRGKYKNFQAVSINRY